MTIDDSESAVRPPTDPEIRPMTDREFALFQALIRREAGIGLGPSKKSLLTGRLFHRVRELGLHSFGEYYHRVTDGSPAGVNAEECAQMLNRVCTYETHFFREPRQFGFLEQRVFPEWKAQAAAGTRTRRIRIWSAACSTGEEPYSMAMLLSEHFPRLSGWTVEILATDLSTQALEQAQAAVWPVEKAKEIPPRYLKPYMLQGTRSQEGKMKGGSSIRSMVRFERLNLHDETYPEIGLFDLILCRNVLIYFDAESKTRAVHRVLDHLAPTGYLLLGQSESLNGLTDRIRTIFPTVYVHADLSERPHKPLNPTASSAAATAPPEKAAPIRK